MFANTSKLAVESSKQELDLGKMLPPGARHYRAFVGQPERYDLRAAVQFNILAELGLREEHHVLDIGCGSIRAGRLLIPYLLADRYCGLEPEEWLVRDGIRLELGESIVELKSPHFEFNKDFDFSVFNRKFDYVMAQSIFTHAAMHQIQTCLRNVASVLKPEAVLLATFVEGELEYRGDEWQYPRCISYPFEFFVEAAEQAGLICRRFPWPDPTAMTWLIFHRAEYTGWDTVSKDHSGTFREYLRLLNEVQQLKSELEIGKLEMQRILKHPYVSFGLRTRRILNGLFGI